jgi:serine/threonine protein kinase
MEWIGGGSLFDSLVSRDAPFSEEEARFFSAQVLLALQSLHANDIVYRYGFHISICFLV